MSASEILIEYRRQYALLTDAKTRNGYRAAALLGVLHIEQKLNEPFPSPTLIEQLQLTRQMLGLNE